MRHKVGELTAPRGEEISYANVCAIKCLRIATIFKLLEKVTKLSGYKALCWKYKIKTLPFRGIFLLKRNEIQFK